MPFLRKQESLTVEYTVARDSRAKEATYIGMTMFPRVDDIEYREVGISKLKVVSTFTNLFSQQPDYGWYRYRYQQRYAGFLLPSLLPIDFLHVFLALLQQPEHTYFRNQ